MIGSPIITKETLDQFASNFDGTVGRTTEPRFKNPMLSGLTETSIEHGS